MFNPCAVIPVYNHENALPDTVAGVLKYLPVILIDDGSGEMCKKVISELAINNKKIALITREKNGGKGAAVKSGLLSAYNLGYTHALQIDADGQHDIDDIPTFISTAKQLPNTLISGTPVYDSSVPKGRLYARYITHIWVWINTLSLTIKDSMCGFRVYPLKPARDLISEQYVGNRMDFDTEIIVRWYWQELPIKEIATRVIYPEQGVSHFLGLKDNWLISKMHARCFFGMLWRFPRLFTRSIKKMFL